MIPKQQVLDRAQLESLQPTTVDKDYVLGWLLFAIAAHSSLSRWVFKGGTCLKKCFFETYRFSEDLDFTIPRGEPLDETIIAAGLVDLANWIEQESGIVFPREGIKVEGYDNKRGKPSFQAKVSYSGPLKLPRHSLQRIKFDLTQDEAITGTPARRAVFHPYSDAPRPPHQVLCYSAEEIVAEKTRALYERHGRSRDVYDIVHLSRNFRESIDPALARKMVAEKFAFKALPTPSVDLILGQVDTEVLQANWAPQLGHQLPVLPDAALFRAELHDAIAWWLDPPTEKQRLAPLQPKKDETVLPRQPFSVFDLGVTTGESAMKALVYAARNHLCAMVEYDGVRRIVEPYSLRRHKTGNLLLYVHEVERGGVPTGGTKAFKVKELSLAIVTHRPFTPRYRVEL